MKVTRVALGPGYGVPALTPSFDVAVGGETAESGGNAEYILDAAADGQKKGMILLGHMMSEDWGMQRSRRVVATAGAGSHRRVDSRGRTVQCPKSNCGLPIVDC